MANPEVFDILSSMDWERLIPELTAYTVWLAKCYHFPDRCVVFPKGKSVEDLVFEAITKVFTGERKWKPEMVDIRTYLKGVIRSLHSHLYDGPEHTWRDYQNPSDDDFFQSRIIPLLTLTNTPEQQLYVEQFKKYLKQSAWDDISMKIINCILKEMNRKEIGEKLRLDPSTVSRYIKKIRVIADDFLVEETE